MEIKIPFNPIYEGKRNHSQINFLKVFFKEVLKKAEKETQFVVLSGAMGSGKSVAAQYIIARLMLEYKQLKVGLGRMSIDAVKTTFYKELKDMIPTEVVSQDNAESLSLINGSSVHCKGWGDKNTRKIRSDNYHIFVLEEVTEDAVRQGSFNLNKEALKEIIGRTRNPAPAGITDKKYPNIIFLITNPDDPEHWLYKEYIALAGYVNGQKTTNINREENINVFYSVTTDNPYLKESYKEALYKKMSKNEGKRYVEGKWVSLSGEGVYNEYREEEHYQGNKVYEPNPSIDELLSWDFNTGAGKPMSACMAQFIKDEFHFFDEVVMENSNTRAMMIELEARGYFKRFSGTTRRLVILGDASGWANHAAADYSDYGFMEMFLNSLPYKVNYTIKTPISNPEIKARHQLVNLYLKNFKNEVRIHIYAPAHNPQLVSTLHRGFKSVKLRKGANYLEDDSNPTQHITTAAGYLIWYCVHNTGKQAKTLNF